MLEVGEECKPSCQVPVDEDIELFVVVAGFFERVAAVYHAQGLLPHEVQKLAGHAGIETTMRYYVAVKDTIVDRARVASSTALAGNFAARLLRAPENEPFSKNKRHQEPPKDLMSLHLQKLGATGLEPATS